MSSTPAGMARKYGDMDTIAMRCNAGDAMHRNVRGLRPREVRGTALPRTDGFHNNSFALGRRPRSPCGALHGKRRPPRSEVVRDSGILAVFV